MFIRISVKNGETRVLGYTREIGRATIYLPLLPFVPPMDVEAAIDAILAELAMPMAARRQAHNSAPKPTIGGNNG